MTYRPPPRTHFTEPTLIRYDQAIRSLWGDEDSGQVSDWFYVSSEEIHALVFALRPGGHYRHSEQYRTVYSGDVCYYVLQGTLTLHNPETGEVQVANAGEAAFFQTDAWHHGYNFGEQELKIWEVYAPPPARGGGIAYAQTRPNLTEVRYSRDELLGRWPAAQGEATPHPLRVIRSPDLLWRLEGKQRQIPVALFLSTPCLTAGRVRLLPGQVSESERHAGDEILYVLEGRLNVFVPDLGRWLEAHPGDGVYLPLGVVHQYHNVSDRPAAFFFGVAPSSLPMPASER
jgi:quercetin dioxygenase-like cupin family protein